MSAQRRRSKASCIIATACLMASCAHALTPTKQGIAYAVANGQTLTLDYYAGAGVGPHPMAILVGSETGDAANSTDCTELLTQSGYHAFVLNRRTVTGNPYSSTVENVQRAIRFLRFHAFDWNGDNTKMSLIGGPSARYVSLIVGLMNSSGAMGSDNAVNRESARVQAVVSVFGSGSTSEGPGGNYHALLDPLIRELGDEAALARSSPNYMNPDSPAFLLLYTSGSQAGPLPETSELPKVLQNVGVRCDLLEAAPGTASGSNQAPEWERRMLDWLNKTLGRQHTRP